MLPLPAMLALLTVMAISDTATPVDGRLVDATTAAPIVGAEITVVGQRGTVKTDATGRFRWAIAPPMPAVVVVVLLDGRVARPISLAAIDATTELTIAVDAMLGELVVVLGTAPAVDAAPRLAADSPAERSSSLGAAVDSTSRFALR